jgi:antitoxin component YwqK of YwqJK toxin-antitoxin module
VAKAEAQIHHVLLREGTSFPQGAHMAPERSAETCKVCSHRASTVRVGGQPDHGSKCRNGRHEVDLREKQNGVTMARMPAKLSADCLCLSEPFLTRYTVNNDRRRHWWEDRCDFWLALAIVFSLAFFSACSRKELREEKYPSGAIKSRGYVKQDAEKNYISVGLWIYWYENGKKKQEQTYKDGKLEELTTLWYESGQKKEESTYKAGKLEGPYTAWYDNGRKKVEGVYRDAMPSGERGETGVLKNGRQGLWTFWSEGGQKEEESPYNDGKLEGLATNWYENGQKKKERTFKSDELDGLWIYWYENGKKKEEGTYKAGKLEGPYTFWYENGKKKGVGTYRSDELEGLYTFWYENGQKKGESIYKNGKLEGPYLSWYENGQKKEESTYKAGKLEGRHLTWYETGQKDMECTLKEGKLEGLATNWYENGQKKAEGIYKDGISGHYSEWYENGSRAKAGMLTAMSDQPEVVTDENDILRFGKPTVKKTSRGVTKVLVEAQNVTNRKVSCTVKATFLKGESIIGTASDILNGIPAGNSKTAELTTDDDVEAYDTLKLKTHICF